MARLLGVLVTLLVVGGTARADVITPDVSSCRGKAAGASCESGDITTGVCEASSCSRRDYTNGPPGETVTEPCLRCVAVATKEPAKAEPPTAPTATPKPAAKGTGCAIDAGAPTALGSLLLGAILIALARRSRRG
jgi:hypothetical protein